MKMDIKDNSDEAKKWREYSRKPLDEKRKRYKCGDHYVTLKDVLPWSKYHQENLYYFKSRIEKGKEISKKHTVDIKLNDKVSLWTGDITALEIDAIVNAANTTLLGGGGVDGCIHRAAGDNLFKECRKLRGCQTGEAKITLGHRLPAKYVIHTAGPMGKNRKKLQDCYKNCLQLAKQHGVKTLAFCCISTGIYGYPNKDAAHVALETVRQWLETDDNNDSVERIVFCTFLPKDTEIYERLLLCYFPCEDPQKEEMSPVSSNNRGTVSPSESPNKKESFPLHEPPEGEAAPPCVPSNKREASSSGTAMNESPAVKVMPPSDTVESQSDDKMDILDPSNIPDPPKLEDFVEELNPEEKLARHQGTVSPSESPNKRESFPLREAPEGEAALPCVPSNRREASSFGTAMNESPAVEGPAVKVMPPSDTVESQSDDKMDILDPSNIPDPPKLEDFVEELNPEEKLARHQGTVSPSESPNKRESFPLHEAPEGEAALPCVPSNKREASSSGIAMDEGPADKGPAVKVMPLSDTVESQNEEKM